MILYTSPTIPAELVDGETFEEGPSFLDGLGGFDFSVLDLGTTTRCYLCIRRRFVNTEITSVLLMMVPTSPGSIVTTFMDYSSKIMGFFLG